ncbi:MAG: hypothetical protein JXP48_14990 [Acidobacteria bacterium]|nr:hypothetical protein [Acidobacteriota bacterium]
MELSLPVEQEREIEAIEALQRPGPGAAVSLCRHRALSCVRCCLPHIGGDTHRAPSGAWIGPGGLLLRFENFNPRHDPRIEASGYEDAFADVGREEMERRFARRRRLFLEIYDPRRPLESLPRYMKAIAGAEGYRYRHPASSGPASLHVGGSLPAGPRGRGELPECQLLGFTDEGGRPGCLAHPLAETSGGHDGRLLAGFFHHTGCCDCVECEAGREFRYLSPSALGMFDRAVEGLSWYEYSRHATSVLVYYLRAFDHLLVRMNEAAGLGRLPLRQLASFTNALYDDWPFQRPGAAVPGTPGMGFMNTLDLLRTPIPLPERILYIALRTGFRADTFGAQLGRAREWIMRRMERL